MEGKPSAGHCVHCAAAAAFNVTSINDQTLIHLLFLLFSGRAYKHTQTAIRVNRILSLSLSLVPPYSRWFSLSSVICSGAHRPDHSFPADRTRERRRSPFFFEIVSLIEIDCTPLSLSFLFLFSNFYKIISLKRRQNLKNT